MDILFDAAKLSPGQGILWTEVMCPLIRRVLEAGYIAVAQGASGSVYLGGLKQSPDYLIITPKGRDFLREFGQHEL